MIPPRESVHDCPFHQFTKLKCERYGVIAANFLSVLSLLKDGHNDRCAPILWDPFLVPTVIHYFTEHGDCVVWEVLAEFGSYSIWSCTLSVLQSSDTLSLSPLSLYLKILLPLLFVGRVSWGAWQLCGECFLIYWTYLS